VELRGDAGTHRASATAGRWSPETLLFDVRQAVRALAGQPAVTALAVATMALGIGAVTAIFTVVRAVLLSPPPFDEPDELLLLSERTADGEEMSAAWPNYLDWRRDARVFEGLAAYRNEGFGLTLPEGPVRVYGGQVSADFFRLLGVEPLLGRTFTAEEDRPGGPRAVILTHRAWRTWFGGDRSVLNRSVRLDGEPHTVVGVLRPDFRFLQPDEDLYVPIGPWGDEPSWLDRGNHWDLLAVGRLREGVTAADAAAELDVIARRLEREHPRTNSGQRVDARRFDEVRVQDVRSPLRLLFAAVGFVLLIACANVANLLLAAGARRRREVAVRAAVGASPPRIARHLLTESVLLSGAGAAAGVGLAVWGTGPLAALAPADIVGLDRVRVDGAVLAFAAGVALLTGLAFGSVPALHAARLDLRGALNDESRGSTSRSQQRVRGALLIAEIALALVLLVGAGLMLRTLLRLAAVEPGFTPDSVLSAAVVLPDGRYGEPERRETFVFEAVRRLGELPGVRSAAAVLCPPVAGSCWGSIYLVGGRPVPRQDRLPRARFNVATPDYFRTTGIPLLEGRGFTTADRAGAPPVIVVNETMARLHWPGRSPLGERIKRGWPQDDEPFREIVGVVGDVPQDGLAATPLPEVYFPYGQQRPSYLTLVARTSGDPMRLARPLVREIRGLDGDLPVEDVQPLAGYLAESTASRRFYGQLLGVFAGLAIFLAGIGVYGVVAGAVSHRTAEIGIRRAVGAGRREVLALVLRQALGPLLAGLALGLAGAAALTRILEALLFGVSTRDVPTFVGVSLVLVAVALTACAIPARRALGVSPLVALRGE
jgi:putative ABC transport system permease protein